jgi:hypothetical protein
LFARHAAAQALSGISKTGNLFHVHEGVRSRPE